MDRVHLLLRTGLRRRFRDGRVLRSEDFAVWLKRILCLEASALYMGDMKHMKHHESQSFNHTYSRRASDRWQPGGEMGAICSAHLEKTAT